MAVFAVMLASGTAAEDLAWPVECALGETCFVQHYLDRDPGPGVQDAGCGTLTYDGHDGVDIALPNRAAMAQGVTVKAAMPGRVKAIRDGLADAAPFPKGQDCGNGVVIDSMDGQEQYCHLRQGSVAVKPGDTVTTGTPIGLVGQSGNADFPHLHLTVRRGGHPVDPFDTASTCGDPAELWAELWADPLPYVPAGLVQAGIADAIPDYDAVKTDALPAPRAHQGALVLWAEVFGARPGDILTFDLQGPQGALYRGRSLLDRAQDRSFRAQGRKLDAPPGAYQGSITLMREGRILDRAALSVQLD